SAALTASRPAELSPALGRLVRSMNCYYSNLIEGHHTHPVDIQRALAGNYDTAPDKRNLQLEACAHIEVQESIDEGQAPFPAVSEDFLHWAHHEFFERLPPDFTTARNPLTGEQQHVVPGAWRDRHVQVGRHRAPSPDQIPQLVHQFVEAYTPPKRPKTDQIIAIAAAHHRLLWIHPFLDGNGRVARLLSHAMLRELGVGSNLWSVSRGLARQVGDYKAKLADADEPRHGDLDGRGNLSDRALYEFCRFFLEVCLDQVRFMSGLLDPERFLARITIWAEEEVAAGRIPRGSVSLLRHVALSGAISRRDTARVTGYRERQARTVTGALLARGCLTSDSPRAPLRLGFPPDLAEQWLPLLYPPELPPHP
ncbi:MAG: Fic family protein, partial [Hyphomicrobiaceae bacterium]